MRKLLGSASSLDNLKKLIEQFYCGTKITLNEDNSVSNSSGIIQGVKWIKKGNRYHVERV